MKFGSPDRRASSRIGFVLCCLLLALCGDATQARRPAAAEAQAKRAGAAEPYPGEPQDLDVARRYAPVFYQRLSSRGIDRRFDYITNFDFDGDWAGNNNWENAADRKFPMRGYAYYSVVETESHYFITYAVFHARDWSAVQPLLGTVMDQIQKSEKYGKYLPPELRQQLELNHENDMEGAQVIVRKAGLAGTGDAPEHVQAVETVAHDEFHAYLPSNTSLSLSGAREHEGRLELEQGRPALYVEAQKHGVHAYPYQHGHRAGSIFDVPDGPLLIYRYRGVAEDPDSNEKNDRSDVGYDLLPLYSTFWKKARGLAKPDRTFGAVFDFGDLYCRQLPAGVAARIAKNLCRLGSTGIALRGDYAGKNKALLPWGWGSHLESQLAPGDWFLNPVQMMRAHFGDAEFSEVYVSNPFLGIFRDGAAGSESSGLPAVP